MPTTLTDNAANFPAVTAPIQSDALSTVDIRAGLQALADRTAAIRIGGQVMTLRSGTMAAMKALAFGAVVGGQIFLVYGYGIFEYVELIANNVPFQVPSDDGLGHWLLHPAGVRDIAKGWPTLDATARLASTKIRNGIISCTGASFTSGPSSTYATTASTSYVDVGSALLAVTGAAVNDLLRVDASFRMVAGAAGGFSRLIIVDGAGTNALQEFGHGNNVDTVVTFAWTFPVTSAGTQTIKPQFKANTSGTQSAYGVSLNATLIRP